MHWWYDWRRSARGLAVDHRTDIFSLGVMTYKLLSGRRPFEGETASDEIVTLLTVEPMPLRSIAPQAPAELEQLVGRCLAKEREARYESAAKLRADLRAIQRQVDEANDGTLVMDGATTVLNRVQRPETSKAIPDRPRRRLPRRRQVIVAGFTLAFILAALTVFWRLIESDYFWQNPLVGARVERLTDFEGDEVDAAVSPDGKFITFLSDREGPLDAWVSQIGSGEFVNITKGRFPTTTPTRL